MVVVCNGTFYASSQRQHDNENVKYAANLHSHFSQYLLLHEIIFSNIFIITVCTKGINECGEREREREREMGGEREREREGGGRGERERELNICLSNKM